MRLPLLSAFLLSSLLLAAAPAWAQDPAQSPPPDASAQPSAQPALPPPPPPAPAPSTQVAPPPPAPPVAAAPPPAPPPVKPPWPTRSLRIGPSVQVLLYKPFEKTAIVGPGIFGAYEFYLSRKFALGINLSYRLHTGAEQLHEIGYGLLLKHYLAGTDSPDSIFMPYLSYGLLLQLAFQTGHKGSGTAHDTRLSAGTDFRIAKQIFFVEGAWHYSRLKLFESSQYKLDYLEFDLGWRYPW
jgi:hypothetical protein